MSFVTQMFKVKDTENKQKVYKCKIISNIQIKKILEKSLKSIFYFFMYSEKY